VADFLQWKAALTVVSRQSRNIRPERHSFAYISGFFFLLLPTSSCGAPMSTAITNLADTLPVSAGAIASRPLIDLPGDLKLVLFAMDEAQEISAHSAPFPATVLCIAGKLEVMVDGAWSTIAPGEHIDLPKGRPHGVKAAQPSHWLLTMQRGQ
jgi:quercetin dioxygenase-like cupin family protein